MAVKVPLVRDSTTNLPVEMSSADTISGVVYTTGTQSIGGAKTFTSLITTSENVTNGPMTINAQTTSDIFTMNNPGNSPAGSYVALTSPMASPGIIGMNGGSYRTDLVFGTSGIFKIGVSANSSGPSYQYQFTSGGDFSTTGSIASVGHTFGSTVASSSTDLSKHMALYSTSYGLCITANRLNYVAPSSSSHKFVVNSVDVATIASTGLQLGTGVSISKITLSTSAPGTLAAGELYLQY